MIPTIQATMNRGLRNTEPSDEQNGRRGGKTSGLLLLSISTGVNIKSRSPLFLGSR